MSRQIEFWKDTEDQILLETVRSFLTEGKTQADAFQHTALHLGRTYNACAFRYKNVLRKKEESLNLEESKKSEEHPLSSDKSKRSDGAPSTSWEKVKEFMEDTFNKIKVLEESNHKLKERLHDLERENQLLKQQSIFTNEEYEVLTKILKRVHGNLEVKNENIEKIG